MREAAALGSGTKALTVIGSLLTGGDSIDDVAVLRAGASSSLFDLTMAPSRVPALTYRTVPMVR